MDPASQRIRGVLLIIAGIGVMWASRSSDRKNDGMNIVMGMWRFIGVVMILGGIVWIVSPTWASP